MRKRRYLVMLSRVLAPVMVVSLSVVASLVPATPARAAGPAALAFDGVNDQVVVADAANLRLATNITVEARAKPTAVTRHVHIVGKNNWELSLDPSGSGFTASFEVAIGSSWRSATSTVLPIGPWYAFAGTYDGSALRVFVNGQLAGSLALTGSVSQTSNPLRIASADGSGDFFAGTIDEVRLSSVARYSSSYTLATAPFVADASTRGLWHLDEGSGTAAADGSGNGNTGVLTSAPVWTTDSPFGDPPAPDTTAPVISGVAASSVGSTSATVAWTTDELSTSTVEYGLTASYGSATTTDTTLVAAHSRALSGLAVATTYHFRVVSRDGAGNTAVSADATFTTTPAAQGVDTVGEWAPAVNWPLVGVHLIQLYTGEFLVFDAWEIPSRPYIWNPSTNVFTEVPNPHGLFCSGHVALPDGRVLIVGGHAGSELGIKQAYLFDPATRAWSRAPDMSAARWYPTTTTLPDGRVLTLSGMITPTSWADVPEIYNPATNTWSQLSGVNTADMHEHEYPLSFLEPNGRVASIISTTGQLKELDVNARTWTPVATTTAINGSAVMYRPGKLLTTGGGDLDRAGPATTTSQVIDLTAASPTWRTVAPMANRRYMHNLLVLADGSVLAIGGHDTANQAGHTGPRAVERWDPTTESWSSMSPMRDLRGYHSTTVLLPDGRVLTAGGGRFSSALNFNTAQIWSPPYLFKGPRPTIAAAPTSVALGSSIVVRSPDAAAISTVSLTKLASNTHSLDMDQHYVPMTFTRAGDDLSVQVPANAAVLPPGYYMLTIVNSNGVPSVSSTVLVGTTVVADTEPPTVALSAPANGATVQGNVTVTAAANDNRGVASVEFTLDGNPLGSPDTIAPFAATWDTTSVANGPHVLGARATDTSGNVATATTRSVTVANPAPDVTPPTITGVGASGIASNSATVSWTTDEPADSQVDFGTTESYGQSSTLAPALSTSHSQTLTGLAPNTAYHYRVRSRDAAGNVSVSPDATFTTAALSQLFCDLTAPANGTTVSGSITVSAAASGDAGVTGVRFQVDGATVGAEDAAAPYELSWDTRTVPNGQRTVVAVARDTTGATKSSDPVIVTVSNPSTPGLVAAYNFDEGAGAVLRDRTTRQHDGAVSGASWSASGRTGGALSFDGVNDIVTIPDSNDFDLTNAMTLEAWVRPTSTTGWRTVLMKERPGNLAYALYASGSPTRPSAFLDIGGSDRSVTGPSVLPVNTWSHLALTYDGTTLRLYVNGTQAASAAQTGLATTSASPLQIGGNTPWGEWFAGLVDDARIYNRALTAAEVVTDRDTPVAAASPDTVVPSSPTGLIATGGTGTAQLTWGAATDNVGVVGYDVHRATTPGFTVSAGNRVASTTATAFADSGLVPGTYLYRVVARDAAGNVSPPSNEASANVTADTTPPQVSITAPAAGATVSGSVTVTANATDAGGVASVQFQLDGQPLGSPDTSAPYSVVWTTSTATNGTQALSAVARDVAGNSTVSAGVSVAVQNAPPPANGPVASFNFNEGTGAILTDRTGRGHAGAVSGAAWSAAGHAGGALSFDGVNDVVTIADAADLDLTNAMTIEAWVRPTSTTGWRTVVMKERPGGLCYALYATGVPARPSVYATIGAADQNTTGTATLAVNAWSHLTATYDGATMRLYLNGTQVATRAMNAAMATSAGSLAIGGNSVWGEWFAGLIDDVRVYNRVLTPTEIVTDRDTPVS